jgi:hypothetical protein
MATDRWLRVIGPNFIAGISFDTKRASPKLARFLAEGEGKLRETARSRGWQIEAMAPTPQELREAIVLDQGTSPERANAPPQSVQPVPAPQSAQEPGAPRHRKIEVDDETHLARPAASKKKSSTSKTAKRKKPTSK